MLARRLVPFGVAALLVLSAHPSARAAGEWGTIKGRVVLDGDIPKPTPIVPDNDRKECEKKGSLFSQEYVVDEKTKGLRWVVVWLMPADYDEENQTAKFKKINPDAEPKDKEVVIDQPCCQFEPRVVVLRIGKQSLVVNNPAPMPHNIMISGGSYGPSINELIAPGKRLAVPGAWKPTLRSGAVPFSCTIHKWMKGYIRAFDHPYYAVTNEKGEFEIKGAPAGRCRLAVWHETTWVVGEKDKQRYGIPITVVADKTTDLGDIKMKPGS